MTQRLAVVLCAIALSATAVALVQWNGWTLYYGDAESHLDIARRIVDSRTPGYDQIGTGWLPLTHALMLPFVVNDGLWRNGLAGAIPAAASFVFAACFLFAAARRLFGSGSAAAGAVACFAMNPNLLYLQGIPMTEAVFFAAMMGVLYCTVAYRQTMSLGWAAGAGAASLCGTLTRYEGWFLVPFIAMFFLFKAPAWRPWAFLLFGSLAVLGPLYWLAHNWWYFGDPLDFYRGPYSALAIQGGKPYPGFHDWPKAWKYFIHCTRLVAGWGIIGPALAGIGVALWKRLWWPLALFALLPIFYVWSLHSSGNPIFMPDLPPFSYYNTRYGLAALPLLALCAGACVLAAPQKFRTAVTIAIVTLSVLPWLARPYPDQWVCWKESQVNSDTRRAWTHSAAAYLRANYQPGVGIFSALGDLAGVYREAGIPLREVLHEGNGPAWMAAGARPDLFLHEEWAVTRGAQPADYRTMAVIAVKGAPALTILKRN